ncbi:MAG TPA: choline ABC transporter ATP-binding protein [Geminicoccus sp.]|uniref:choline ABC transporter ATP-binding protein n=1 Tax=Geminicoccus sp. TaxID=2024832 RepID=UPI002C5788E6|nr:choline ABC transporter ATP-binding protein [Geminicoccus sp.]HWL69747.1 choline ABC transporter ATP-binding protein [Geminicoccus sp.]
MSGMGAGGASAAVVFDQVDILFGGRPERALPLVEQGHSRERILAETGQVVGVAGASLSIEPGQICVLMGLSGSGKSTLLRAVNRLNRVTRGRVLIQDDGRAVDVQACDAATLRRLRTRRIAMVFQQFALLPWRTVAENVGFGLELRGMAAAERKRIVQEKLELVGLAQWAGKHADELSGGMQQRVGLARAFATDADILLMDEPFSALDPLIRMRLQDELLELQRRLNKTILFVSHDLDEALKLGSTIAIMEDARIIQAGPPEEIVARPATDYVRDFVANVNPLNVLTARHLMRDRHDLEPCGDGWLWLDRRRSTAVLLDDGGVLLQARHGQHDLSLVPMEALAGQSEQLAVARPAAPMRQVIQIMNASGRPVPLVDEAGRLVGAVGMRDVLGAILRRHEQPA